MAIKLIQSLIMILALSWLGMVLYVYFFQHKLVFVPEKLFITTPESIRLKYENILLKTQDGLNIHGWYLPHPNEIGKLLFLHGNAGNVSYEIDSLQLYHDLNLSVLIVDYPGYGNSEGSMSEIGSYEAAQLAWDYLTEVLNPNHLPTYILGRSLGGGVASWLVANTTTPPTGLVLESTFTSIEDLGRYYYPYLPIHWIGQIHYPNLSNIRKIKVPILYIHSPEDKIVPYKMSGELYDNTTTDKQFVDIRGRHGDGFLTSKKQYLKSLQNFIHRPQQTIE